MSFTMAHVCLGQPYWKNKPYQRCRPLKGLVPATYSAKSLSEKVVKSWSITESQSLFQVPLWQGSLKIPLKDLLPVEGAAHPATVPKETHPPSEGTKGEEKSGWGSGVFWAGVTRASHLGKKGSWLVHTYRYIRLGKPAAKSP